MAVLAVVVIGAKAPPWSKLPPPPELAEPRQAGVGLMLDALLDKGVAVLEVATGEAGVDESAIIYLPCMTKGS